MESASDLDIHLKNLNDLARTCNRIAKIPTLTPEQNLAWSLISAARELLDEKYVTSSKAEYISSELQKFIKTPEEAQEALMKAIFGDRSHQIPGE